MSDIDEVSEKLGSIDNKVDYVCDRLDEVQTDMPSYTDEDIEELEETAEEAHTKAEKHDRWWGWLVTGVSSIFAFLGFIITLTYDSIIKLISKVANG